ncbi:MAG: oxidoreductase [Rhodococcus sp.]|nr:oxidoreductase [Rhodococcus sp. (in: high G+C Gram-positive bacteria)]
MKTAALQASWGKVVEVGEPAIQYFYSHLFLSHPEVRDMFPVSMTAQRDRFFAALGHIITNVESLPTDRAYLEQLGREHRRFGVVAAHYPAAGASLMATLARFLGPAWTPELRREWESAYGVVADIMVSAAEASKSSTPAWWDAEITGVKRHSLDITLLEIRTFEPYPYVAGQSMAIEVPNRPRTWRYFSPASAQRDDHTMELHVEIVPGGQVSPDLARNVRPGDIIKLGAPVGHKLTLDPDHSGNLLMVAGGTGLAPLRAVVEELDNRWGTSSAAPNVLLFHGVRYTPNLYDHAYLKHMSSRPWFTYIPVVSHDPTFPGQRGLVGTVAAEMYWWEGYTAMVCGSEGMVRHTVSELVRTGLDPKAIRHEDFTPHAPTASPKPAEVPA